MRIAENLGRMVFELASPTGNLGGMNPVLAGQFAHGLDAFQSFHGHLGLEIVTELFSHPHLDLLGC